MRKRRTINVIRKDLSVKKRKAVKKRVANPRVPRTRNAGTMTESEYFGKIRSGLRNTFRWWKPMLIALEAAARPCKGSHCGRLKKEYQCAECENWFSRRMVEIDHREECGSLSCYEDIIIFIQRLTREEPEAYQILCRTCHKGKTKKYHESKKVA